MKPLLCLLFVLAALPLEAQNRIPIRVCTYNVLDYGPVEQGKRIDALGVVLGSIRPDILVVQDLLGPYGHGDFAGDLVTYFPFTKGMGFDGPDTENGIFLTDKIEFIHHIGHPTALRNIDEFVLLIKGTTDTIHFFICHLSEGEAQADVEARFQESLVIRGAMELIPPHHHSILAGDLNVYSSSEPAYNQLTYIGGLPTLFVDPINRPGNWHANPSFADVHTQSPRVRSFGGGTVGGLDDRFDFVLLSPSLMDGEHVSGSYTTYGNDGQHFNDSINAQPNAAVSPAIAQALHDASDHLPVYLDLLFQRQSIGVENEPVWKSKEVDLSDATGKR